MQNNSPTKQKILQFIDTLGISKREFYAKTGISRGTLESPTGITESILAKFIAVYPEFDLSGEKKSEKRRTTAIAQLDIVTASPMPDTPASESERIPMVEASAVAGFGNSDFALHKSDVKDYYVVPKFKDRRIDFMIEVSGSSMYPKYNSGDVVACTILRESRFIQWNKVHIIGTEEQGILIKRVKKGPSESELLLISDNKDYDPFVININEVTGMALVVGVIRLE